MSSIDADLFPNEFIDDAESYLSNLKSNLINSQNYTNYYISYIEDNLDNLLKIVFPFVLHKGKAIKGLRFGLSEYSKTINEHVKNGFSEIKLAQENAIKIKSELNDELDEFHRLRAEIEEYRDSIFSEDGLKDNVEKLLNDSELKLYEVKRLHSSIHGEDGLKQEIDQRRSDLDEFKKKQQEKYDEINKQIENLLPGATSAGLSSAYSEMRNKFSENARWYGRGFYISLCILLITVLCIRDVVLVRDIPLDKGIWISLLVLLGNFAVKMPFIIPALWLVIFISRRRSEAERLSQEYAHKEVLAKSYDSYKQQIEKLSKEDQEELLPVLMEGMIKAISLNPAETLDKKHQSDSPFSEVLKNKNFIDSIVDKIKGSSSKS